jgi:hypothetical protein
MLPPSFLHLALLASYDVSASATTTPAPLVTREAMTITFGEEAFESFEVVHVSTPWAIRPMILVAPVGYGAAWFESADTYAGSMLGQLARLGVDVWAIGPRRGTADTLPQGSCLGDPAAPVPAPVDCSAFGRWGVDDLVEDVAFVRELVDGPRAPTIGGHWTGAMVALAAVDAEPEAYEGLVLWEGTILTDDEATLAKNAAVCDALELLPDAYAADSTPSAERLVAELARTDPTGLSPFPQSVLDPYFLTAGVATNLEVLHALLVVDNFALFDRISDGLVFTVGTVEDGPDVADLELMFDFLDAAPQSTYGSLGIFRDLACGLGGSPEHTGNLAAFEGDVLVIGASRGLDDELADTLDAFTGARFVSADFRGELGVHDLLWSDLREGVGIEIALFNAIAQLPF